MIILREVETIQIDVQSHKFPQHMKEDTIINVFFDGEENMVSTEVLENATEEACQSAQQLLEKINRKRKFM
ncbi:hypothetical protein [Metabacillus fastidiosus]|uniref:hypothetical protein n=1 Tax=Metabacillus fastidiosus TaxID=1458 RepID=UPI003D2C0525